jgi:hypothetical protein
VKKPLRLIAICRGLRPSNRGEFSTSTSASSTSHFTTSSESSKTAYVMQARIVRWGSRKENVVTAVKNFIDNDIEESIITEMTSRMTQITNDDQTIEIKFMNNDCRGVADTTTNENLFSMGAYMERISRNTISKVTKVMSYTDSELAFQQGSTQRISGLTLNIIIIIIVIQHKKK